MSPEAAAATEEEWLEEGEEEEGGVAMTKLPSLHALLIGYETLSHLCNMWLQCFLLLLLLWRAQPQLRW